MIAGVLRKHGVKDEAISIIPDEHRAIDAALKMGRQGDLLLIFADALTRSWKQVTKFRPAGAPAEVPVPKSAAPVAAPGDESAEEASAAQGEDALEAAGFVRDERGIRFVKESED